jgi:hypothetical protein
LRVGLGLATRCENCPPPSPPPIYIHKPCELTTPFQHVFLHLFTRVHLPPPFPGRWDRYCTKCTCTDRLLLSANVHIEDIIGK